MKKLFLLALCLLLVALPAAAQEGEGWPEGLPPHSECAEDLTGQTIQMYHFGDFSGPYGPITQPFLAGFADSIAYVNAHGGVCGAMLEQVYDDTGGDIAKTQSIYDRFSTEFDPDFLILYSSADAELLREQLAEAEIPAAISAGSTEGLYGEDGQTPGWIFATNPLYTDQFGAMCDYIAGNPDQFPEPVLGYISWDNAFGRAAYTPETVAYCESVGVEVIDTAEFFSPTTPDIQSQVQNLVDAGATVFYTNTLATGSTLIAATLANMGLDDEIQLTGVNWVMDTSVGLLSAQQGVAGADGMPAANGIIGSLPFHWWSERELPGIQLVIEQADANERPPIVRNIAYLLGWMYTDYFMEVLIQTINRVGFEAMDGADVKETMETLEYTPLGLQTFRFEEGQRALAGNRIARLGYLGENGEEAVLPDNPPVLVQAGDAQFPVPILTPLTDFVPAPDLRPGGADVPAE